MIGFSLFLALFCSFGSFAGSSSCKSCKSCKPTGVVSKDDSKSINKDIRKGRHVVYKKDEKIVKDKNKILSEFFKKENKGLKDEYFDEIANTLLKSKVGFVNLGATCYLNSSLQVLLKCKDFIVSFLKGYYGIERNDFCDAFLYLILKVKEAVEMREKYLGRDVMQYVVTCFNDQDFGFSLFNQNDSSEFTGYFLNNIEFFIPGVTDSFKFKLISTIKCTKSHESESCSYDLSLQVPLINGVNSLCSCIKKDSSKAEKLVESELSRCAGCVSDIVSSSDLCGILKQQIAQCGRCRGFLENQGKSLRPGEYMYMNDNANCIFKCDHCFCVFDKKCDGCSGTHQSCCIYNNVSYCLECQKIERCHDCVKNNKDENYCIKNNHLIYCDECRKRYYTGIEKTCKPSVEGTNNKYMLINLKRYKANGKNLKKDGSVDMEKIAVDVDVDEEIEFDRVTYRLKAAIIQEGGLGSGHYFSYIDVDDNGGWFKFNDSSVGRIDRDGIKKGYIFLYERKE